MMYSYQYLPSPLLANQSIPFFFEKQRGNLSLLAMKSNLLTSDELNHAKYPDDGHGLVIIGATGGFAVDETSIVNVLKKQRQELGREGDFIGKSTTCMMMDENHVIKLHQQTSFTDSRVALRWAELRLQKEQRMGLYHPSRTWFITRTGEQWQAGNITIRLQPFHHLFEDRSLTAKQALPWILQICQKYLAHAASYEERLDEGLSNFGLHDGRLYYLDDDIFAWDHFHAFSALLAGWFRRYSRHWFHAQASSILGHELRRMLYQYFNTDNGVDAPYVIAEQIKSMFFPGGEIQEAADAFRQALLNRSPAGVSEPQENAETLVHYFDEDEPIAILADIHANLPALEAVIQRIQNMGIRRILALGDIVGYGPHPAACIELLQSLGIRSIRGNHDHAIGSGQAVRSMSSSSSWVAEWTQDHITDAQRDYLLQLPTRLSHRPWMAVHGAPVDPTFFNAYVYDRTAEKNLQWLMDEGYRFCLHGHSHIQAVYSMRWGGIMQKIRDVEEVDLSTSATADLICPGAVGQPRGGDCRAAFAVLHPLQQRLQLFRETYNINHTIQDMIIHGFPEQLINRLRDGI